MNKLLSDILLELHVPSFTVAKKFYESIGYEVVWEKPAEGNEGYLVMRSGESILNFYCGNEHVYKHSFFKRFFKTTPRGYAVEIIVPIKGIETFYKKFEQLHPDLVVAKLKRRFSHPDFRAVDPFGFYLRFVEKYNWVDGRDKSGKLPKRLEEFPE